VNQLSDSLVSGFILALSLLTMLKFYQKVMANKESDGSQMARAIMRFLMQMGWVLRGVLKSHSSYVLIAENFLLRLRLRRLLRNSLNSLATQSN